MTRGAGPPRGGVSEKARRMRVKLVLLLVACAALWVVTASRTVAELRKPTDHFVPNSQEFWDFPRHWTTNYGPAYRDTVEDSTNFLACTAQFAFCADSGAKPLPCKLSDDGRFANCTCLVEHGANFVVITAILNYGVYLDTIKVCGTNGASCTLPDEAPVCRFLKNGELIPGAELISTFDTTTVQSIGNAGKPTGPKVTNCDGPFAGCMTAPCQFTRNDQAECSCPVFWGRFQLFGDGAQCDLGPGLVPSASYHPKLDPDVP